LFEQRERFVTNGSLSVFSRPNFAAKTIVPRFSTSFSFCVFLYSFQALQHTPFLPRQETKKPSSRLLFWFSLNNA
jgi:hypothetical protein